MTDISTDARDETNCTNDSKVTINQNSDCLINKNSVTYKQNLGLIVYNCQLHVFKEKVHVYYKHLN